MYTTYLNFLRIVRSYILHIHLKYVALAFGQVFYTLLQKGTLAFGLYSTYLYENRECKKTIIFSGKGCILNELSFCVDIDLDIFCSERSWCTRKSILHIYIHTHSQHLWIRKPYCTQVHNLPQLSPIHPVIYNPYTHTQGDFRPSDCILHTTTEGNFRPTAWILHTVTEGDFRPTACILQ